MHDGRSDGAYPIQSIEGEDVRAPLHSAGTPLAPPLPAPRQLFGRTYLRRLKGAGKSAPTVWAPTIDAIPSCLFTIIALMTLNVIQAFGLERYHLGLESFVASMGPSCVSVLCLFSAPGAQLRSVVLVHVIGAILGVTWKHIFDSLPAVLGSQMATAFSAAMLTSGMMLTNATLPSGTATACIACFLPPSLMNDQEYMFVVTPATLGPSVIVFWGWLLNNLVPWRQSYPLCL